MQSDEELRTIQRYFKTGAGEYGEGDHFIGVRMGHVFDLAKEFIDLPAAEIEALLESDIIWERRTAQYATFYFIRQGDARDALTIAERLVEDPEDLIQKAAGAVLRSICGDELIAFLDRHAARMPRTMLTTAMEHLSAEWKAHHRSL